MALSNAGGVVSLATGSLIPSFNAIGGILTGTDGATAGAYMGLPVTGGIYASGTAATVASSWATLSNARDGSLGLIERPEARFLAEQFSQHSGTVIQALNYLNTAVSASNNAAGDDTEVQFNDGGTEFGAESTFTFTKGSNTMEVTNIAVTNLTASGDMQVDDIFQIAKDKFTLGGTAVTTTGAELNLLDNAAANTVRNSLAVIYSNAGALTGTSITVPTGSMLFVSGTDVQTNKVFLRGAEITSTAAELNLVDGSSAGTVVNSKAVIYSGAGLVQGTDFRVPDGGEIGNATVNDFLVFGADTATFKDGALDVDIASHDATNGLKLGGTLVTSTAAELNLVDGSAANSITMGKAVIYGAQGQVSVGSALSASGMSFFGGTLHASGSNNQSDIGTTTAPFQNGFMRNVILSGTNEQGAAQYYKLSIDGGIFRVSEQGAAGAPPNPA